MKVIMKRTVKMAIITNATNLKNETNHKINKAENTETLKRNPNKDTDTESLRL